MSDFHFFCAICGQALSAWPQAVGGLLECPACHHVVPIPGYPSTPDGPMDCMGIYRPEILEVVMKFLCPHCQSKLSVDARWEGRTSECLVCKTTFKVPSWSGTTARVTPVDSRPSAAPPAPFPLTTLSAEEIEFLSDSGDASVRLAMGSAL